MEKGLWASMSASQTPSCKEDRPLCKFTELGQKTVFLINARSVIGEDLLWNVVFDFGGFLDIFG